MVSLNWKNKSKSKSLACGFENVKNIITKDKNLRKWFGIK